MMRLSAAALVTAFGITLAGCATAPAQLSEGPYADAVVFADVNCRITTTGTVVPKQNCNDLTIDDQTGEIVRR